MMKFFSNRGISLVESLIGMSLVGVIAYGVMTTSNLMNQSSSQQKQIDLVEDMVMKNIYRLRAASSATFPDYGQSHLREYYSNGTLIKETVVSDCSKPTLISGQITVCIKYSSVNDTEVVFSNPESLKLPQYGQKLYKLDLTGETMSSGRRIIKKITIFKR